MSKVKLNNINLNRKVLADLAMNEPKVFKSIIEKIKKTCFFMKNMR